MPANTPRQVLSSEGRSGIVDTVTAAVKVTLRQAFDYTTDFPGFVANPAPATGPFGVAQAIAQQSCRRWARGEGIPSLPGFDYLYGGVCGPYLDSIGEGVQPGDLSPDFLGGQCVGVNYVVEIAGPDGGIGPGVATRTGLGPVGGVVIGQNDFGNVQIGVSFADGLVFGGGGQSSVPAGLAGQWRVVNISRLDGAVDPDCGNPPPRYTPPSIPPGLPPLAPITVNIPGIGPVNIDTTFKPDGTINVDLPDLGIDFDIADPFGLGGDGGGGGGGGDTAPGDDGEPGTEDEASEEDGDAEGEADPGEVLVGLRVEVTEAPPSRKRYTDTVDRGPCYVYMGTEGNLYLDTSAALFRSPQFFFASKDFLTHWRVSANNGYKLRVTPYYRTVEA